MKKKSIGSWTKADYVAYLSGEVTSGKHSGPRVDRLAVIDPPPGYDQANKSMKQKMDKAMTHCKEYFQEFDNFNDGKKIKHFL